MKKVESKKTKTSTYYSAEEVAGMLKELRNRIILGIVAVQVIFDVIAVITKTIF